MAPTHTSVLRSSSIHILLKVARFDLIRLFAMCIVVTLGVGALAWFYPAQRELETAAYQYAGWDISTEIEVFAEDIERVKKDFGEQNVFLTSHWLTPLATDDIEITADVLITLTPKVSSSIGAFPEATLISACGVEDSWIDIDVQTAKALNVQCGDNIVFRVGEGQEAQYQVRGIYGVSPVTGLNPSAVVSGLPITEVFTDVIPGTDGERGVMSNALIKGMSVEQVKQVLSDDFYRSRFIQGGYDDNISMDTPMSRLEHVSKNSSASLGLIQGTSIVAALALLGLVSRETWAFAKNAGRKASILIVIGYPRSRLVASISLVSSFMVGLALSIGCVVAVQVLNSGLLTVAFPPSLSGMFWIINAGVIVSLAALSGVVTWRVLAHAGKKGKANG